MTQKTTAYAIRRITDVGPILDTKTLISSKRGAIVNYLYLREGRRILNSMSDAAILTMWKGRRLPSELVQVAITVTGVIADEDITQQSENWET